MAYVTAAITVDADVVIESAWPGGSGTCIVQGTFGSGTVTLKTSVDGGTTLVSMGTDATFTANGQCGFSLPKGTALYATMAGATSPSVTVYLAPNEAPRAF